MPDLTGQDRDARTTERALPTEPAMLNLRDIGGLPTDSGGMTRHGVLLRGDAPLAGDQLSGGIRWPPSLAVDLRSEAEVLEAPSGWGTDTLVYHLDVHHGATPTVTPDNIDWIGLYGEIMDGAAAHLGELMGLLAAAADRPVLVHCTAGKDRTGVVIALLLLAAGVSEESVIADYMATRVSLSAFLRRHPQFLERSLAPAEGEPGNRRLAVSRTAIVDVIARVSASGAQAWFTSHGVDPVHLAAWRERLTTSIYGRS